MSHIYFLCLLSNKWVVLVLVFFFKKCAVPVDRDALKEFIHMIVERGVDLARYSNANNATDEDR